MAVLLAADFTQATETAMGFPDSRAATDPNGRTVRSVVTGGGPGGRNAVRFTHNPISSAAVTAIGNTQNTHGSALLKTGGYTGVAQGASFFIHLYLRIVTMSNLAVWDPGPVLNTGGFITHKMAIWGNNTGGNDARLILQSKIGDFYGGWNVYIADNVENGPGASFTTADGWTSLIFEARSASTIGGSDGVQRCWKNGAAQNNPTSELTGVQMDSVDAATGLTRLWTGMGFNDFGNETLAENTPTPALVYDIAGLTLRDDFDSTWYTNMNGTTLAAAPAETITISDSIAASLVSSGGIGRPSSILAGVL